MCEQERVGLACPAAIAVAPAGTAVAAGTACCHRSAATRLTCSQSFGQQNAPSQPMSRALETVLSAVSNTQNRQPGRVQIGQPATSYRDGAQGQSPGPAIHVYAKGAAAATYAAIGPNRPNSSAKSPNFRPPLCSKRAAIHREFSEDTCSPAAPRATSISLASLFAIASAKELKSSTTIKKALGPPITFCL
jgi:hypothetical protein